MRRSTGMIATAVVGLTVGLSLALEGWEGLSGFLRLIQEQSARLLGLIVIALSLLVLIRQIRSRPSPPDPTPAPLPPSSRPSEPTSAPPPPPN